jgi:hypothetical protein
MRILRPDRRIGQHLDEDSAHYGPRLKPLLLAGHGVVPIHQRRPAGPLIDETIGRRAKRLKIGPRFGKGSRPEVSITCPFDRAAFSSE